MSDKRRYLTKIADVGDPCTATKEVIPLVTNTDIFNYLVLTTSFCTSEMFKVFKSFDAYKYFMCGFVNCLGSKKIGSKIVTVAKVCKKDKCPYYVV